MTRYHVQASDELMAERQLAWPEGLRPVERGEAAFPGSHWHLFEDDGAPEELEGKRVELVLGRRGRDNAVTVIIERRLL